MDTLLLTETDVHEVARRAGLDALMDALIGRLDAALQTFSPTTTVVLPRHGFSYDRPVPGLLEWMPCMHRNERITIKMVGYHPTNAQRLGLPTIIGTVGEYDTASGHLTCLMDGTLLTALRTGAASAVASRILARPNASVLGLIGAGAQAVTQLHALARTFDLEAVLVHDVDPHAEESFAGRVACVAPGLRIERAPIEEVVGAADVLCTSTSIGVEEGPLFEGDVTHRPWLHVNAVGSDFAGKVELPAALLRRSLVCPDTREQALVEGECQQLDPDALGPDLYALVQTGDRYAEARERPTVFDSTGWALEDQVALRLFADYAETMGLGTRVALEALPEDALNPYHFAAETTAEAAHARSAHRS